MRAQACGYVLAVAMVATTARAQQQQVSTTSIVMGDDLELTTVTTVSMGIRRGVRTRADVRYRHLGDLVERPERPVELFDAEESLETIAADVLSGNVGNAEERATAVVEIFEANLALVRRANLVDAYMLRALAACRQRRGQERCVRGFEQVITFREAVEYDSERYPAELAPLFAETKERLVEEGVRGSVEIITDPPGAEVFVDGRSFGASPTVAEGLLVGDHYVTVKAQGYEEVVQRVTVQEDFQDRVDIALYEGERVRLITEKMPQIRQELGRRTAGPAIQALDALMTARQVVFAVVTPRGDKLGLSMYVYALNTNFLLRHVDGEIDGGADAADQIQALTAQLYEEVSLTGQIEAPDDGATGEGDAIWEQWWFWTAVGVVAAAAVISGVVFFGQESTGCPEQLTCFEASVQ